MRRATSLLLFALAVTGCQRGCLATWITEQGPQPNGSNDPRVAPLTSTDCSDGLVRCHAGLAQASKAGAIAQGCHATPEDPHACECPFVNVATCADGCVVEDVTLVGADATRTCAPPATVEVATLPVAQLAAICDGEGARFRCEHGAVFACADGGAVPVAVCARGCVVDREELDDEEVDVRAAKLLLCVATRQTL